MKRARIDGNLGKSGCHDEITPLVRPNPKVGLRTNRLRFPPAFDAMISRFMMQHFIKLPRLNRRKHPADEFRWNRRQPLGIDEIAFDEVGNSAEPTRGGEQPGMHQRRSADDNDAAIAK